METVQDKLYYLRNYLNEKDLDKIVKHRTPEEVIMLTELLSLEDIPEHKKWALTHYLLYAKVKQMEEF